MKGGPERIGLARGEHDPSFARHMLLLVAVSATIALGAVAVLAGSFDSPSASPRAGAQLLASPSELAASRKLGAAERQFWTARTPGGLRAQNATQQFRASFRRSGLQVSVPGAHVGLSLTALGRAGHLAPLSEPALSTKANTVLYSRGGLREWYANGPLGLEQGLRLNAPPPGARGELSLAYKLSGLPHVSLAGGQLSFSGSNGASLLRYGGLNATDALGKTLTARLALAGSRLLIEVNDSGARYPVSIDPLIQGPAASRLGAAALAMTFSTEMSLSITPLNAAGKAWSTADQGVGNPLKAKVTITNAPYNETVTVVPSHVTAAPKGAVTATGPSVPPVPSGGYSLAPGASATFTEPLKVTKPGLGTLMDTLNWNEQPCAYAGPGCGPQELLGTQDVELGSGVSGTVYNMSCGPNSCKRTGLKDATILAKGKATDGTPILKTHKSSAQGTYTVGVPAGTYTVGPSPDSKKIDGAGFDPTERTPVTVPAAAVAGGQDFSTCALTKKVGTARDAAAGAAPASGGGPVGHAAAVTPSACKSIYTVSVAAKIPQSKLVDPSVHARYEVNGGGGYNNSLRGDALTPEFPECFTQAEIKHYSPDLAPETKIVQHKGGPTKVTIPSPGAEWYSYIEGGKLGSVKVAFAWDRKAQKVELVRGPGFTHEEMTRVFVWRLHLRGNKTVFGRCHETHEVEMLVLPAGGADVGSALSDRQFSLIAAWEFPFEPAGVRVNGDLLVNKASAALAHIFALVKHYDKAIEHVVGNLPYYRNLPKPVRFGIEFAAGDLLGTGYLKIAEAAPQLAHHFFAGARYGSQLIAGLEAGATLAEGTHQAKRLQEVVGFLAGYANKGGYPVMGAVIRGRFQVSGYVKVGSDQIPLDSVLAMSAEHTKFPTISVKVSREAEANVDPKNPVTTGLLPWSSMASPQLDIFNILSSNPAYLLSDAAKSHYSVGLHGVNAVHANTSQTPELTKAVHEHEEEETDFTAEVNEAAVPGCSAFSAYPDVGSFLCYKFNDGRP